MSLSLTNAQRAEVLTQALPYIKKYNGKVVVIKYGGNAMINDHLKEQVMEDIVLLSLIGVGVVLGWRCGGSGVGVAGGVGWLVLGVRSALAAAVSVVIWRCFGVKKVISSRPACALSNLLIKPNGLKTEL